MADAYRLERGAIYAVTVPAKATADELAELAKQLNAWGKDLDIRFIVLADGMQINAIPMKATPL